MSDEIGHHCGIALVRLKKPLAHYSEKYGTALWGFNQLFLLMEKQHNRGQDGAGIGSMKLNMPPGEAFMFRERSTSTKALTKIFGGQHKSLDNLYEGGKAFPEFPETLRNISIMVEKFSWASDMELRERMGRPPATLIFARAIGRGKISWWREFQSYQRRLS